MCISLEESLYVTSFGKMSMSCILWEECSYGKMFICCILREEYSYAASYLKMSICHVILWEEYPCFTSCGKNVHMLHPVGRICICCIIWEDAHGLYLMGRMSICCILWEECSYVASHGKMSFVTSYGKNVSMRGRMSFLHPLRKMSACCILRQGCLF